MKLNYPGSCRTLRSILPAGIGIFLKEMTPALLRYSFPVLMVLCGVLLAAAGNAFAGTPIVQTFYIPIPEDQIRTWEVGIATGGPSPITDTTVNDVVSITATMDNTIIYYDQWEDGYETDITSPKQSTTQIWGDGDISNGAPPGCSSNACDVISAGTVITLQNSVPLVQSGASYVRDQGNIYFDARDKIASTGQLVITRAGWLTPTGTVLSGATEILDTRKWDTSFVVPVGTDSNNAVAGTMFNYAAASIMASADNTVVQVVDRNGNAVGASPYTLNQGQSIYIPNITYGTQISSSAPVQVNMMTGTLQTNYEGRWFTLIPQNQWSNSYYCPVATVSAADPAAVILYNPGTSQITVNVSLTGGGTATVTVPAQNIARYNMPQNTAARFYTTGSPAPDFFAVFTNDYNLQAYEWAAMMIPETSLTPSVVVGWAPGNANNPPTSNVDVIWVTPAANTTIYVNYSGNPNVGPNTDPYGNKYDVSYVVNALQSQRISNPTTFTMTGARIYTVDGTRIAAFWGEDASTGVTGLPGIDIGTAILPFPTLTAYKTAALIGDFNSNGGIDPGELIAYTIRVHNSGIFPITNIVLTDTLDANVTYVAGTTGYSTSQSGPYTPVADSPLGTSPLTGGFTVVASPAQLNPGQDMYVRFQVTVNNPLPSGVTALKNIVTATSASLQNLTTVNEIFTNLQSSLVEQGALATVKTASPSGTVKPGDTVSYTITVTNTSTTSQTGITLNDPLPPGATYAANSTAATGPMLKYVRDMFNQLSYGNNDGPQGWKADWVENDAAGGSQDPLTGNVQVINGALRLAASGSSASRAVDLTTGIAGLNFTSATLSFDYRTSPAVIATDSVVVEISADGTTFTTLDTFTNIAGQTSGTRSYDISSYISASTTVRFRITGGYTGASDFFYADNVAIRTNELAGVTKDNITGGANADLQSGVPATLVTAADGFALAPGETLTSTYSIRVNNPATASRVTNTVSTTSTEQSQAASSTTINPIGTGGNISGFIWLDSIANGAYDFGEPLLSNVRVWLDTNGNGVFDPGVDIQTMTGTDGAYIFAGLLPGSYVVHVDESTLPAGLTIATANNPTSAFVVTDQEQYPNVDFGYKNGNAGTAIIGSYVWSDADNNGIREAGESGLGGVTMQLLTSPGNVLVATATTNSFGTYLFTNVAPGTYVVKADTAVILTGYTPTTGPQSVGSKTSNPLTVAGGGTYVMENFGFYNASTYSVGDVIWFDSDNNGALDPGEPGIKDVTATLLNAGGSVVAATSTDVYGNFMFSGMPAGGYTIRVTDTNGKLTGFGGTTTAALSGQLAVNIAGANVTGTSFGYNAPGRIGNIIWMDYNGNGIRDNGEPGIAGVTVKLYQDTNGNGIFEPATDTLMATTTTDAAGGYSFQVPQAGRFFVSVDSAQAPLSGLVLTTSDDQPTAGYQKTVMFYDLFAGDMTANFGFNTPGTAAITGLVWNDLNSNTFQDTGEHGISGVTVQLYRDANGNNAFDPSADTPVATTTTDSNGNYGFQVSQTGTYFVSIDDTQPALRSMIPTTADAWPLASGVQQTVSVGQLNTSYPANSFGFVALNSDLGVTKTSSPSGNVKPGDTVTYTITITNNSATTTQTGIAVNDPVPTFTTFVSGTVNGYSNYVTTSTTLNASHDSYINQNATGNNYGGSTGLILQYRSGRTMRPLVQFDLSSIPALATVNSAQLQFYWTASNAALTAHVYSLTRSWVEGTGNNNACGTSGNGATWNTYNCTNNWAAAGGDYNAAEIGNFVLNGTNNAYQGLSNANLLSVVQGWLQSPATNYGVILNGTAGGNQQATLSSRENGNNHPAQLIVNYTYLPTNTKTLSSGSFPNIVNSSDGFVLPPGQSMTVTYQVTVNGSLPPGVSQILNEATVSSSQTAPAKAFVTNGLTYTNDIAVTKTVQSLSSPCSPGSCQVSYLITASNVGAVNEGNVQVTDQLPAGKLTFVSNSASRGSYSSATGVWSIGTLNAGASATLVITAQVNAWNVTIQNCAGLTASTPADSNSGNDSSCASIVPTQALISGFGAYAEQGGVVIEWETASENNTAGFYLLRRDESTGRFIQINQRLLPGLLSAPQGGTYRLTDTGAAPDRAYTYILVEVDSNGAKTAYGPFTVAGNETIGNLGMLNAVNPSLLVDHMTQDRKDTVRKYVNGEGTVVISLGGAGTAGNAAELYSGYARVPHGTRPAGKAFDSISARRAAATVTVNTSVMGRRLRISIARDGLYFLSASEISRLLGMQLLEVGHALQSMQFTLTSQGKNIAYLPAADSSGLYFFGQAMTGVYTKENVYWLYNGPGLAMTALRAAAPGPVSQEITFGDTVHVERDLIAVPALFSDPNADYWFWDYVIAGDPAYGTKTFSFEAGDVADTPATATVTVHLYGFTDTGADPDHHSVIGVNGTTIGEGKWNGAAPYDLALTFDQKLLQSGANTLSVTGLLDTGAPYSIFYLNSFDISYQRLYRAEGNALFLNGGGNPVVTITGFTDPNIMVFDLTDPLRPVLNGSTTVDGADGDYEVSFAPSSPANRYLAVSASAASTDLHVSSVSLPDLRSRRNAADYIIIAPSGLAGTAQALAKYRKGQGLTPMVVTLENVMNEFNSGISSPKAVQDFLSYAWSHWMKRPKYVLLAGKGTYDYKDNLGYGDNLLPPVIGVTPNGLAPADNLFGDFGTDHVPAVAVGRLPVTTSAELQNAIDKIIAYEENRGSRIVLAADVPDDGGDFVSDSEAVASLIPAVHPVTKIYLPNYTTDAARQMLLNEINNGATILNFVGHGGVDRLAREGLMLKSDVSSMTNVSKPHILIGITCVAGQFAIPGYQTLSEALLTNPGAGAAAVWAPTGLTLDTFSKVLDESFFTSAFTGGRPRLGDLVLKALRTYSNGGGPLYIPDIYTLLGDPAMRVW